MHSKILQITFIILLFSGVTIAQCEFPNSSFEEWSNQPFTLSDGGEGEVTNDVFFPDNNTLFLRLFFLAFGAAFDPSIGDILLDDPQGLVGVTQSEDASDGEFAVKLQSSYGYSVTDLYNVAQCEELPEMISLDVKHVGNTSDTLTIFVIFDQGLAPLPQDSSGLADVPAYAVSETVYNSDTEYASINIPVIQNFEADIDTMYYVILSETASDESYFLIDNIISGEDTNDCTVSAPEISLTNETVQLCNCSEFASEIKLEYSESQFELIQVIIDNDGFIYESTFPDEGIFGSVCADVDFSTAVIAINDENIDIDDISNINELEGCFEVSNIVPITTITIQEFDFSLQIDGVDAEDEFEICLADDMIELLSYTSNSQDFTTTSLLLLDQESGDIVDVFEGVEGTTTLMGLEPGNYTMGVLQTTGNIPLEIGSNVDIFEDIIFDGCIGASTNFYEFVVLEPSDCVSSVYDIDESPIGVPYNISSGIFELTNLDNLVYSVDVINISGNRVASFSNSELIDITSQPSGMYFMIITTSEGDFRAKLYKN